MPKRPDEYFMSDSIVESLPANVEAERTILGAILLDNEAMIEAGAILQADDLSLDSHRRIFLRMKELSDAKQPVDIITLANILAQNKEIEAVGGVAYLASLTEGLPRRPVISEYIRIAKDKSLLRRLMLVCSSAIARAADQSESAIDVAGSIMGQITEVVNRSGEETEVYGPEQMANEAEERLSETAPDTVVIPTGIPSLDDFTGGGIRLGELWVVGASPARGKTTLARQIAKNCVWRDIPTYIHSGEMDKESWFDVTACLLAGMPAWKIRERKLMNWTERERLKEAVRELKKLPFYISDVGSIPIDRLIWHAKRQKQMYGMQLLVVDYAQIIWAKAKDEREKVSKIAERLRQFAKDEKVAVILLSASPRPEGKNINRRPTMFDLKESGALEASAHVVLLLYRPIDLDNGKFTSEDEIIVGKNRWGSTGAIPVHLNGEYLRFDAR